MLFRFVDGAARDAFLDRLGREHPDLFALAKPSYSQADVLTLRDGEPDALDRIRKLATAEAKSYSDVQLSPTAKAGEGRK